MFLWSCVAQVQTVEMGPTTRYSRYYTETCNVMSAGGVISAAWRLSNTALKKHRSGGKPLATRRLIWSGWKSNLRTPAKIAISSSTMLNANKTKRNILKSLISICFSGDCARTQLCLRQSNARTSDGYTRPTSCFYSR